MLVAQATDDPDTALADQIRAVELWLSVGEFDSALPTLRTLAADFGWPLSQSGRLSVPYALGLQLSNVARRYVPNDFMANACVPSGAHPITIAPKAIARVNLARCIATTQGVVDFQSALAFQALHVYEALRSRDRGSVAKALATELLMSGSSGRPSWRIRVLIAQIEARDLTLEAPLDHAWVELAGGYLDFLCGRFLAAEQRLTAASELFGHDQRARWEADYCRAHQLFSLRYLGRFDALTEGYAHALRSLQARQARVQLAYLIAGAGHVVALWRGDWREAERRLTIAETAYGAVLPMTLRYVFGCAFVDIALWRGDGEAALARIEAMARQIRPMLIHHAVAGNLALMRSLAWLMQRDSQPTRAPAMARRYARRLAKITRSFAAPLAGALIAQADWLEGEDDAVVVPPLETAHATLLERGMLLHAEAVRALLDLRADRNINDDARHGMLRAAGAGLLPPPPAEAAHHD